MPLFSAVNSGMRGVLKTHRAFHLDSNVKVFLKPVCVLSPDQANNNFIKRSRP